MQHEAHPGLPDYGEVSSRERALEQYAQDLHRREIQLMRDRIHKKPVGGGAGSMPCAACWHVWHVRWLEGMHVACFPCSDAILTQRKYGF